MLVANLPRYEMGRCVSCGDCNREPAYVDESGEWVKFEEAMVASSNNLQQLKAEIAALASEIENDISTGAKPYNHSRIVTILRQLSAV